MPGNQGKCVRVCVAPCMGAIECLAAMPALLAAAVEASCTLTLRPAPLAALERYFLPLSSCGSSDNPEELRFEISEASAAAPSPLASGLQVGARHLNPLDEGIRFDPCLAQSIACSYLTRSRSAGQCACIPLPATLKRACPLSSQGGWRCGSMMAATAIEAARQG